MYIQNIVVGAGFAGAVMARRIAEELNEEVLVIDKRNHIAGNAYDRYDEQGILIHQYGPHIFHTNNRSVWDWVARFSPWIHYQHRVLSYVDGQLVPFPVCCDAINLLLGTRMNVEEFKQWLENQREPIKEIKSSADVILSQAGNFVYEKFFKHYTYKQWKRSAEELDRLVFSRVPVRLDRDLRYFKDPYQGMPAYGYTALFEKILDHPKIHLLLNTDWQQMKSGLAWDRLIYTGRVDQFFNLEYGELEYRSLEFEFEKYPDIDQFQPVATVNYPNDYAYTRITEFKHLTGQRHCGTTIAKEYPAETGEPYYPVPDVPNLEKAQRYAERASAEPKTIFLGRLAEYKYFNMDQVIERALGIDLNVLMGKS